MEAIVFNWGKTPKTQPMAVSRQIGVQAVGPDACPSGIGLSVVPWSLNIPHSIRVWAAFTHLPQLRVCLLFPCSHSLSLLAYANFSYPTSDLFFLPQIITCAFQFACPPTSAPCLALVFGNPCFPSKAVSWVRSFLPMRCPASRGSWFLLCLCVRHACVVSECHSAVTRNRGHKVETCFTVFSRAELYLKCRDISDVFFSPRQKSHCTESPKSDVRSTQAFAEIVDPLPGNQEHRDSD